MKILITECSEISELICSKRCSPAIIKNAIISVTHDEKRVNIWVPTSECDTRTSLAGHKQKISAFSITPKTHNFICTCSTDKIILWKMNNSILSDGCGFPTGMTFGFDFGFIDHCTFSWNDEWLALCRENEVIVIKIKWSDDDNLDFDVTHHATLEMKSGNGNVCAFSPSNGDIIVTIDDGCYFKVWNIHSVRLLYKSPKLGMYSIAHCSLASDPPYLLLGTSEALLYIYNFKEPDNPRHLTTVNVRKAFLSDEKIKGTGKTDFSLGKMNSNESIELNLDCGEVGCITFGIYVFKYEVQSLKTGEREMESENTVISNFLKITDKTLKSILYPTAVIAVCCNLGIALYNCNSWECEAILKISDMLPTTTFSPKTSPLLSFLVIGGDNLDSFTCMVKMSLNDSKIRILNLQVIDEYICKSGIAVQETGDTGFEKSVIPFETVRKSSPLRYQMTTILNSLTNPYAVKDKKTKSSGYGKSSKTQMFFPVINKSKVRIEKRSLTRKSLLSLKPQLDCISGKSVIANSGPPTKAGPKFCFWETTGTQVQLAVSGDGRNLACSSTDSYICVVKFSDMNPEKGLNLLGHDGPINSLHFSFNSRWLLSSSNDPSAKVWDWQHKKCIISINNNSPSKKGTSISQNKEGLKNSISRAQFYYMDQFVLTASQDYLKLFSHLLHEIDGEQIHENLTKTKQVCKIRVPAQQITCFSAVNQFHSYKILCCCSSRSIQVYDMNVQKFITEIHKIHSRPAHHMKQMEGSQAMAHPPGMYNLFITAAVGDSTKLWDLRSGSCVQKYCQPMNRAYSCGIDISPCGCYVAIGSEDKYVYLYDTRKCSDYLHKLGGLGDTVMDVSFNPHRPMLAAAALNGYICSYTAA